MQRSNPAPRGKSDSVQASFSGAVIRALDGLPLSFAVGASVPNSLLPHFLAISGTCRKGHPRRLPLFIGVRAVDRSSR